MKIYEVIKLACLFTENDELAKKIKEEEFDINNEQFDDNDKFLLNSFLNYFNLVNSEIAGYSINKTNIICDVIQGRIEKASIGNYQNIISIKSGNKKVKFKEFQDYIEVAKELKSVVVTVVSMPSNVNFTDDFNFKIPERIYAYGIAREFYLNQGLYEDADIYESRFKDGLKLHLNNISKTGKIPALRWLL